MLVLGPPFPRSDTGCIVSFLQPQVLGQSVYGRVRQVDITHHPVRGATKTTPNSNKNVTGRRIGAVLFVCFFAGARTAEYDNMADAHGKRAARKARLL